MRVMCGLTPDFYPRLEFVKALPKSTALVHDHQRPLLVYLHLCWYHAELCTISMHQTVCAQSHCP